MNMQFQDRRWMQSGSRTHMGDIVAGNFAPYQRQTWPPQFIRVVDWNINKSLRLSEITGFLAAQRADVITLQEVDGTDRQNIAEDIARTLGMNYVFAPCEDLTQESGMLAAYQGQATLVPLAAGEHQSARAPHSAISGAAGRRHCPGNRSRCVWIALRCLQPPSREPG